MNKSEGMYGIEENKLILQKNIQSKIYTIREVQVMLDRDLAILYGVKTKRLNEQVKRNIKRFPSHYMFKLTKKEKEEVVANCDHLKELKFSPVNPYVFSEQGVSMLASILNSNTAIEISIQIIDAFIAMRKFLISQAPVLYKLDQIEKIQLEQAVTLKKHDKKFNQVFRAIDSFKKEKEARQGIFFDGQIFDAYKFVLSLIRKASKSLIIIDNYVDDTVLTMLDERIQNVSALIITKKIDGKIKLALEKHNNQYPAVKIKGTDKFHDRYMIIDNKEVYHIGASLKDAGRKCFGFSKVEDAAYINSLIKRIERLYK